MLIIIYKTKKLGLASLPGPEVQIGVLQRNLLTNGNVFRRTDKRWGGTIWYDAVAVQSGWIDMNNMDLMHEYPRILWKYMKLRVCNNITNSRHKRPKSSEIVRFQNFSDWQGQKDLNPRHSVLEKVCEIFPGSMFPPCCKGFGGSALPRQSPFDALLMLWRTHACF